MKQNKNKAWLFLLIVLIIYIVIGVMKQDILIPALQFFLSVIRKIIPIFILVFVLMIITNYFTNQKYITKHLGQDSGLRGWLLSIGAGLISTGPIFMWYPLLKNLQNLGVKKRFIAAFLYSRAVKPALIPLLIVYFGLTYTIVLIVVMIIMSVFQGLTVEKLSEV